MKLIVCLDQNNGMLFNHRRQSRDRQVYRNILETVGDGKLWMNAYSARQFADADICIHEAFWHHAGSDDFCFAETGEFSDCLAAADRLIVYRWDRVYPADVFFPWDSTWQCISTEIFPGHSHAEITKEVYAL